MSSSSDDQSVSSDDDQPVAKKQKTYMYDADGPIEDDKTAREKLRKVGFDPDDAHSAHSEDVVGRRAWGGENVTPMAYFASIGDLPMCRYLYHVRGATTTAVAAEHMAVPLDEEIFSPLYAAIYYCHPRVAKWLFCHGAKEDAFVYADSNDPKPLSLCFRKIRRDRWSNDTDDACREMVDLAQWFILNGALEFIPGQLDPSQALACCAATVHASVLGMRIDEDNPIVSITHAKNAMDEAMPVLLSLSEDLLLQTDAFHTFLLGTIPTPNFSDKELKHLLVKKLGSEEAASMIVLREIEANGNGQALWDQLQSDIGRPKSTNSCLAAHPGISERIGAYVGFVKSKTKIHRLRSFHEIASHLTISNLPEHCFEFT